MARALPQPGEIIADKYLVTGLIGRGGMGAVYVVEHRVTGKRLAVKCLLPEHTEHPELVERFLREAQAAGRIQHRCVVDVFDVGRDGELLYIVMELIDGKQLCDLLRDTTLPAEDILVILLRAMEGVAAAHTQGIVHRDLKPENILVCRGPSGRFDDPRVLDFGISKLQEDSAKPLTRSGMMMGTPYYMSFEQINSQRDLDQRVDVYAMGVIMYEALAGRVPYLAESVGALAIRMMSGPPESLAALRPDLAPALVAVVMRSIARERDERYPTMHALIDALSPFVEPDLSLTPSRSSSLSTARGSAPLAGSRGDAAHASVTVREGERAPAGLRLSVGDAHTLRSTPARGEGQLHVDEDDESARPPTGAHDFPLGKLVFAALGVLIALTVSIVFWRRGAADEGEAPPAARVEGPAANAPPPLPVPAPEGTVPASAEPLKHVDGLADAAAEQVLGGALKIAEPDLEEEEESKTPGRKGIHKPKKHKRAGLTLDQMVPKAPALPADEREPEPPDPAPEITEPPPAAAPPVVESPAQ